MASSSRSSDYAELILGKHPFPAIGEQIRYHRVSLNIVQIRSAIDLGSISKAFHHESAVYRLVPSDLLKGGRSTAFIS